jgi:pimeloyl-ACP methyl ester carboxylesterase
MAEQLRHSLVVLVPNAGHFHPITRPSFFARELTNFVGSQAVPQ